LHDQRLQDTKKVRDPSQPDDLRLYQYAGRKVLIGIRNEAAQAGLLTVPVKEGQYD
jgi:hypothetical protein